MSRSRRSKIIAQRDRERRARGRLQEQAAAEANFRRLQTMTSGFARTPRPKDMVLEKPKGNILFDASEAVTKQRPNAHVLPNRQKRKYEGEMALRELKAKLEAEALKARVGQVGNKMGPQYLTDTDLADSRQGLLRRR